MENKIPEEEVLAKLGRRPVFSIHMEQEFFKVRQPRRVYQNEINVIRVYIVKTQLYLLGVYRISTTIGTTTCFGH